MKICDLIRTYPRLWHMAEDGSWPSISERGLLSTSALLDLYDVCGERRFAIESCHRPESVTISKAGLPDAVIRDQKPMSTEALNKCLEPGITAQVWYETLNDKTFFWTSRERLRRLLGARAYRETPQIVLTINTETLVNQHSGRIYLSPINSGSTIFNPQPRGSSTFLPIEDYPFEDWKQKRTSAAKAVAEVVVSGGVPDIASHVLAVHRVVQSNADLVWRSPAASGDDGP